PGDLGPTVGGRGGVVVGAAGLARPRPAGSHLVPFDGTAHATLVVQAAQFTKSVLLPHFPLRALHELEHRDVEPRIPRPQRHPERGGRLSLARPGVHGHQGRVAARSRGEPVVGNGVWPALRHWNSPSQAAPRTTPVRLSARSCANRTTGAPRWPANCSANPKRTQDVSQSTTTDDAPSAASTAAAASARPTGSGPPVARPSVRTTTRLRRAGSRIRSRATMSRAARRPCARGVFPPVSNRPSRRDAMCTEAVGGSNTCAPSPRNVITATLSRR